jgi:hypothetical protein
MPNYRARKINIRLVASSLSDCTTIDPNTESPSEASRCEDALLKGTPLPEHLIPCPEDDHNLRFIENDDIACPFYLVHVGRDLPESIIQKSQPRLATRHHDASAANVVNSRKHDTTASNGQHPSPSATSKIDPDCQPYGLGVLIELTSLSAEHKSTRSKVPLPDLRYDVILNGDLLLSHYVPGTELNPDDQILQTVIAGGKRVQDVIERPVVVIPFGVDATGELLTSIRGKYTMQERWESIGKALAGHARELRYWLKEGETESPLATFLDALAAFELPSALEMLVPKGAQSFGIIDVVVSRGKGTTAKDDKSMHKATLMQKEHCQTDGNDKTYVDVSVTPVHNQ